MSINRKALLSYCILTGLMVLLIPGRPGQTEKNCEPDTNTVKLGQGYYKDFLRAKKEDSIKVNSFVLDKYPVTNEKFQAFLKTNPEWKKEAVKPVFADKGYLQHWSQGIKNMQAPVVNVSWYAADAYCRCQGKRLPTLAEWEYAASKPLKSKLNGKHLNNDSVILAWYSRTTPAQLSSVTSGLENTAGVYAMHGMIWEWVDDFNSVLLPKDSRNKDLSKLFCGSGSVGVADPSDYATYMRYVLRGTIKANYTGKILGFRCASDIPKK